MDVTEAIKKMTDRQFKELMDAATPFEKFAFSLARDQGVKVVYSEMVPDGYVWPQ